VVKEVRLSEESWKRYKQLRDEAVVAISENELQLEPNAAVRILRLGQLTSGHIGKTSATEIELGFPEYALAEDLSTEKMDWCFEYLSEECSAHGVIVWCRWRRERERLVEQLRAAGFEVYEIYGGQPKEEREIAKKIFNARSSAIRSVGRPIVLVGQPQAGGISIDMAQASEVIRLSNDYNYTTLVQSDDRPYGPAQKNTPQS
jgi:hypothetical protein